MKKYEYKKVKINPPIITFLNSYSDFGWEFVSKEGDEFYFKREIKESTELSNREFHYKNCEKVKELESDCEGCFYVDDKAKCTCKQDKTREKIKEFIEKRMILFSQSTNHSIPEQKTILQFNISVDKLTDEIMNVIKKGE